MVVAVAPERPRLSGLGFTTSTFHTRLRATSNDDKSFESEDPFVILDLSPTTDKGEIKRAYRRMAMKYHPDVVLSDESTKQDKQAANERFAAINAAYEILTGKREAPKPSGGRKGGGGGYQPPHRRSSSYAGASGGTGVDWTDFMPRDDDDERYDAGGDSFGSIFADLLSGLGSAAAASGGGGGGVFRDLVDFLEGNVEGFSAGSYDESDPAVRDLLRYGTLKEIKEETDDTELLVRQLEKKYSDLANEERKTETGSDNGVGSFKERMEAEERLEEVRARKKVVEGYLTKAKRRLVKLQTKYTELRTNERSSRQASYDSGSPSSPSSSYSSSSSSSTSSSASTGSPSTSTTTSSSSSADKKDDDSWKREGFGSSGRGRGRGRRRTATTASTPPPPPPSRSPPAPAPAPRSSATRTASEDLANSLVELRSTPPHRRGSSQTKTVLENKKRLRELEVEDEFERLKKEMGL